MVINNDAMDPQEIPAAMKRMQDRIKVMNKEIHLLNEKLSFYRQTKLEIERVYTTMTRVKLSRGALEPIKKLVEFQG